MKQSARWTLQRLNVSNSELPDFAILVAIVLITALFLL
jgi:hypothetical protein